MTFENFKEMLEEYDFKVQEFGAGYYVFYKEKPVTHYYTESSRIFLTNEFYEMPNTKKAIVLKALARYIEELPEKKYYYVAPFGKNSVRHLKYKKRDGLFCLSTHREDSVCQTQFTDKEIDEILAKIDDESTTRFVRGLEKVEVESE